MYVHTKVLKVIAVAAVPVLVAAVIAAAYMNQ